ncbi:MAG: sigma-70 family RNA polymerase sigma factor [Bryobacteraceae bacterium]|jgi:RNA polymerase sigma-70 factor (ECF subfamily)
MEPTVASQPVFAAREIPRVEIRDFEEVVRLHWPRVFRFVLASVRDQDAAQTLAQDCFLRAHRAWKRFRGESSVRTWLMQIAANLVRDYARSRRLQFWRRAGLSAVDIGKAADWLADGEVSAESRALLAERVREVWNAAGSLPERQRTVFLLRFVEDMELLEIAAATGMKEGTVKTHLFRALQTVREKLGRTA